MSQALGKLGRKLTADKKKLSLMIALSAVLLLLWGRLMLKRGSPKTAVAEPEAAAVETDQASPPKPVTTKDYPVVYVDLPRSVDRDIFRFRIDRYRQAGAVQDIDDGEKSPPKSPDNGMDVEEVRKWAESLELQAAVLGDEPKVMISDRVYRLGDRINGFVVKSVRSRSVVLANGHIEINLEMGN